MNSSDPLNTAISSYGNTLDLKKHIKERSLNYSALAIIILVFSVIAVVYFLNMLQWSKGPDFGWSISDQMGVLEVIETSGAAAVAGLRPGDHFTEVNGKKIAPPEISAPSHRVIHSLFIFIEIPQ